MNQRANPEWTDKVITIINEKEKAKKESLPSLLDKTNDKPRSS